MAGGQTAVTHDAAARFTQGRRAGRARRVKLVGLVLFMVALAALGWWAVWWSPLLDVRRVEVVGAHHVSAAELARRYFAGRTDGLRPPDNSEELLVATT